ncbi:MULTISPECIES: hypothetical protein [unclassified Pseudomonas]|uniref:hypothetical protein n=1 Tax=unclassified Pseudomonas TaxID=196821 RepID=UPI000C87C4A9|nr:MULTISPECIES: hypothetical protein [unclassified Pseudomonas]PMU11716.1 hypothetical protein C1Y11_04055 [Pseudomonas sp. FW305-20]PMU15396.1 hypothetical protein C1Y10_22515 [Pseudomonas sp. FW305-122]PMU43239.1 hypothetical protein C1Y12_03470 [Pseudomonas sp. FW305-47B]PMX63530.1 hypothetical protein C1X12_22655 [Pseudomonas sp. FW305-60]PMX64564.1 hypothetical protein C1Y13_04265 [Pseudomonas sp. FW305-33]
MDSETQMVISALNETKYKWRTISGISRETGVSGEKIEEIITNNSDQIVQSSALTPKGEALYTTREKHHKETSTWSRIGLAIRNRAG